MSKTEPKPLLDSSTGPPSLAASAKASLLWGGGFTLIRDLAQFGVMMILVRLLTPADYGAAAIAQSIIGIASVVSFGTFSGHALQIRDPNQIDWQAHFTAAVAINTVLAAFVLLTAYGLSFSQKYSNAALPLAVLAVVFLVEIPGTLRHRMLESTHDWKRFRILVMIGTLLGMSIGVVVGLSGGGVWALIVQIPLFGIPAAIDLFLIEKFKVDWSWSWARWRDTFKFGRDRIAAAIIIRSRILNEQTLLTSIYDLATLGIFNRTIGLATLVAGRIGSVAMLSLMPILTRAETGSARIMRLGDLVLRGVVWLTLPAAVLLGLTAADVVQLLYGTQWANVTALLPLAALAVGLGGIISSLSSLLLANNRSRLSLAFDVGAAGSAIVLAVVLVPYGAWVYLAGLSVHSVVMTLAVSVILLKVGALSARGIGAAFVPAIISCAAGLAVAVLLRREVGVIDSFTLRLATDALSFGITYVFLLRLAFARPFAELLEVVPGGALLERALNIRTGLPS